MKVRKKVRLTVRPTMKARVITVTFAELQSAERLGISKEDYVRALIAIREMR
jgi:hypothetical protein